MGRGLLLWPLGVALPIPLLTWVLGGLRGGYCQAVWRERAYERAEAGCEPGLRRLRFPGRFRRRAHCPTLAA